MFFFFFNQSVFSHRSTAASQCRFSCPGEQVQQHVVITAPTSECYLECYPTPVHLQALQTSLTHHTVSLAHCKWNPYYAQPGNTSAWQLPAIECTIGLEILHSAENKCFQWREVRKNLIQWWFGEFFQQKRNLWEIFWGYFSSNGKFFKIWVNLDIYIF